MCTGESRGKWITGACQSCRVRPTAIVARRSGKFRVKLSSLEFESARGVPTATDETDSNRGEKERDYL